MNDEPRYEIVPVKERNKIRDKKIRALYRINQSMDATVIEMKRLGYGVSKTTVFFAINGRSKKAVEKRKIRTSLLKHQK